MHGVATAAKNSTTDFQPIKLPNTHRRSLLQGIVFPEQQPELQFKSHCPLACELDHNKNSKNFNTSARKITKTFLTADVYAAKRLIISLLKSFT